MDKGLIGGWSNYDGEACQKEEFNKWFGMTIKLGIMTQALLWWWRPWEVLWEASGLDNKVQIPFGRLNGGVLIDGLGYGAAADLVLMILLGLAFVIGDLVCAAREDSSDVGRLR